jgi:hypothetical protein
VTVFLPNPVATTSSSWIFFNVVNNRYSSRKILGCQRSFSSRLSRRSLLRGSTSTHPFVDTFAQKRSSGHSTRHRIFYCDRLAVARRLIQLGAHPLAQGERESTCHLRLARRREDLVSKTRRVDATDFFLSWISSLLDFFRIFWKRSQYDKYPLEMK